MKKLWGNLLQCKKNQDKCKGHEMSGKTPNQQQSNPWSQDLFKAKI